MALFHDYLAQAVQLRAITFRPVELSEVEDIEVASKGTFGTTRTFSDSSDNPVALNTPSHNQASVTQFCESENNPSRVLHGSDVSGGKTNLKPQIQALHFWLGLPSIPPVMARINDNFLKLKAGYLFPEIGRRVAAFTEANPDAALIRCGIGDVTEALPKAVQAAMHSAVDELGNRDTFRGYGPEQGYGFLREAVAENAFAGLGISADDVFVSDGSKCDTGNILDIFGPGNTIAITDPVYPVYVDTNVMIGNTGEADDAGRYEGLVYLPCTAENDFVPAIPEEKVDIVYLCYPNNPTGASATREQLQAWVDYALKNDAIILYDAAYEAFIQDTDVPKSIYEIEGAKECALEFRSFSKNGGFTGVRCGYIVIPDTVFGTTESGEKISIKQLWSRRTSTKFNGASYPVQRGAEAIFSPEGKAEVSALVEHYMANAKLLRDACTELGLQVFGGENAPYVWVACPEGLTSWDMFDKMLQEANVVITPGSGFGAAGEGYFRISAFNSRANVEEVCKRLKALL